MIGIMFLVVILLAFATCVFLLNKINSLVDKNKNLWIKLQEAERESRAIEQSKALMKKNFNASHASFMSQAIQSQSFKILKEKLTNKFISHYKKLGQELVGDVTDKAESLGREIEFALSEKIWDSFQQLKEKLDDSPQILPRNVKVAYTKGSRTVIMIEQDPQVRTVTFTGDLLTRNTANQAVGTSFNGYRFNLAFPYVIFCMIFDNDRFSHMELYFRNKTLTSGREHLYLAPLPNVHRDRPVAREAGSKLMCMGNDFWDKIAEENTISRQCDLIIAEFWQRSFNSHLGTGNHDKLDSRLATFATWQAETQKDPLFILTVQWNNAKTAKGVVEAALDRRTRQGELDSIDKQIKTILDSNVTKITKGINEVCKKEIALDLNANLIDDITRADLESVITDHTNKVFQHCTKG